MKLSNKQLRLAAVQAAIKISDEYPDVPEYRFTPSFEERSKLLFTMRKRMVKVHQSITRIKYAAALFFAGILIFLSINTEVRADIMDWIREQAENAYNYFFTDERKETPPTGYQPQWVPDGYELLLCDSIPSSTTYLYQGKRNGAEDYITVTYTFLEPEMPLNIFPMEENYTIKQVTIWGDHPAELYLAGEETECNTLVWGDARYNIAFIISTYLGEEEILKMAENLIPVYTQDVPNG